MDLRNLYISIDSQSLNKSTIKFESDPKSDSKLVALTFKRLKTRAFFNGNKLYSKTKTEPKNNSKARDPAFPVSRRVSEHKFGAPTCCCSTDV